eukprot:620026-Amphidinium_carterae.1
MHSGCKSQLVSYGNVIDEQLGKDAVEPRRIGQRQSEPAHMQCKHQGQGRRLSWHGTWCH